jgi:hypothetical protein
MIAACFGRRAGVGGEKEREVVVGGKRDAKSSSNQNEPPFCARDGFIV